MGILTRLRDIRCILVLRFYIVSIYRIKYFQNSLNWNRCPINKS